MPIDRDEIHPRILRASTPFFEQGFDDWLDSQIHTEAPDALKQVEPIARALLASPEYSSSFRLTAPPLLRDDHFWIAPTSTSSGENVLAILNALRRSPEAHHLVVRHPQLLSPLHISFSPSEVLPEMGPIYSPAIHEVLPTQILGLIEFLLPNNQGAWLDIGSGNGKSLQNLAKKYPQAQFTGYDVLTNTSAATLEMWDGFPNLDGGLPENATYHLSYPFAELSAKDGSGQKRVLPDRVVIDKVDFPYLQWNRRAPWLAAAHLKKLFGNATADVTSMLYPNSKNLDALSLMIHSALCALKPEGTGLILTESPLAAAHAIATLDASGKVENTWYSPTPLTQEQIGKFGIEPYRPQQGQETFRNIGRLGNEVLNCGYPVAFQRYPTWRQRIFFGKVNPLASRA